MHSNNHIKLDNPVWHSLSEAHRSLAVVYNGMKFYQPDYCPFGGFEKIAPDIPYTASYEKLADNFFIVGEKPSLPQTLTLKKELVCLQMIARKRIDVQYTETIVALTDEHRSALYTLVDLVQPGYFKKKTALLGNYSGIFKNGELVAVTGERMKMNKYTEVSAVVTHPDHTGKGYARQLVAHTVNIIFDENKTPYLHVLETNTGAIKLYEKLDFTTRRKISFWNIVSNG